MSAKHQPKIPLVYLKRLQPEALQQVLALKKMVESFPRTFSFKKAVELENRLAPSLELLPKISTKQALALTMRSLTFDKLVRAFCLKHKDAIIVELNCGLSSRYERIKPSQGHWYHVDSSDTYLCWKYFCSEHERRTFLVNDEQTTEAWLNVVLEHRQAVLVILEEVSATGLQQFKQLMAAKRQQEQPQLEVLFASRPSNKEVSLKLGMAWLSANDVVQNKTPVLYAPLDVSLASAQREPWLNRIRLKLKYLQLKLMAILFSCRIASLSVGS